MKNVFSVILLLGCMTVFGQEAAQKVSWQFGASGGITTGGSSSVNTAYEFSDKSGFRTGAFAKYFFNPRYAIVSEIEFERRGFGLQVYNNGLQISDTSSLICWECYYTSSIDYQSFYLTFPFYLEFYKLSGKFGFMFKTGGYFSLTMQSYQDGYEELFIDPEKGLPFAAYGYEPGHYRNIYIGQVQDVVNTYDAGLLFGFGMTYSISEHLGVFTDFIAQFGMVTYFENPEMIETQSFSSSLRLGMYYKMFPLVKNK